MKTNRRVDTSTIKAGVDSRLADLHIDDSMKANILYRIENNNVDIKVYNPKKKTTIKKIVTILIAACLCFAITIPAIGAMVPGVYTNIFNNNNATDPGNTEETAFTDDNNDEYFVMVDNGIDFSVSSAYYDNVNLLLSFELKDTSFSRLEANCLAYNMVIADNSIVDYSWYDTFDPDTEVLTVYMICYNVGIPSDTVMFELDTLFDTRTESAISGVYQQSHEIIFVAGQTINPMLQVGDFVINDFWFSPLSFAISGYGDAASDLLYTMKVYMSDGSYHQFSGGYIFGQNNENTWQYCIETVYSPAGEVLYSNENFVATNLYSDGALSHNVFFYQPLDYENLSYIILSYSGTDQSFMLYL